MVTDDCTFSDMDIHLLHLKWNRKSHLQFSEWFHLIKTQNEPVYLTFLFILHFGQKFFKRKTKKKKKYNIKLEDNMKENYLDSVCLNNELINIITITA